MKKYLLLLLTIMVLLSACDVVLYNEPELFNRSSGWEPSVLDFEIIQLSYLSAKDPVFQSFVFEGSRINDIDSIYIKKYMDITENLTYALNEAFNETYNCKEILDAEVITKGNFVFYVGKYNERAVCTIVESKTGKIIQCVDTRIQKILNKTTDKSLRDGTLYIVVDLTKLSNEDLHIYSMYARNINDTSIPKRFINKEDANNVQKVYEASKSILYRKYSSGVLSSIGRKWFIYDAEKSGCWLIVSNKIILMIEKSTGERLLLVTFLKRYCRDYSIQQTDL